MACASVSFSSSTSAANEIVFGMRRSHSTNDLRCCDIGSKIRRSRSEPHLRCSLIVPKASTTTATKMNSSKSISVLPFNLAIPNPIKTFLFNSHDGIDRDDEEERGEDLVKRANWMERLLELRSLWQDRKQRDDENDDFDVDGDDNYCGVGYDDDEEGTGLMEDVEEEWGPEKFGRFLTKVGWSETKLFAKLAFLCNMAYVIPQIKAEDLRKYYDLHLVTSSHEKKSEAATKANLDSDSTSPNRNRNPNPIGSGPKPASKQPKHLIRPSAAYEIAASAASYVRSRTGGDGGGSHNCDMDDEGTRGGVYESEVAAFVAASTMTAVVAAAEDARLEAARDLRSLHSSPCEWFVCDDPNTCIRCFVIQGSDSLASWQANLLFEPTKFEGTEALVHRGIYEAAKGIYEQFMPDILAHLKRYGNQAKVRLIGHSLGGSLSLLVNLMLRARGAVPLESLLPVVTFGSPSVFCGGRRVMDELGLDEGEICSVMIHRDIVPRAFSCNYPNYAAQVLKRLNGAFRSHPCLNSQKVLYSPIGKLFILQPDEKSSPPHPLLPSGAALYSFDAKDGAGAGGALKAFLNSPHPLETLSKLAAYGSEGTILRDHDSSNYLRAINGLIRQQTKMFVRRSRRQRLGHWWPLLTAERQRLVSKEVVTSV